MRHILLNFPMPPTANKQLIFSRGRLIKSSDARKFDSTVNEYIKRNAKILKEIKADVEPKIAAGLMLRVDTYFCFEREKLLTKDDRPKIIDTNNRIKSTLDAVSKALGIDDKYFSQGYAEKVIKCQKSLSDAHSIIVIEVCSQIELESNILTSVTTSLRPR